MTLRIDVVTIFPELVRQALGHGIVARAIEVGLAQVETHDLRLYTDDRHRRVDDAPFGGGPGMVMRAEPFFRAVEAIMPEGASAERPIVLLSPRGEKFRKDFWAAEVTKMIKVYGAPIDDADVGKIVEYLTATY